MSVPAPCQTLRQRLLDVLTAARVVQARNSDFEKAPTWHQASMIESMTEAALHLREAVRVARDAVPGVSRFIDPLMFGPPGQWTTELNQTLANFEEMYLRGGYRLCLLHPDDWKKNVDDLAERQRFLLNADYSAAPPISINAKQSQERSDKAGESASQVSQPIAVDDESKPSMDRDVVDDFKPASWFKDNTRVPLDRLRHAAQPLRKTKRVRKTTIDGVECYSASDARRWWSTDMKGA